MSTAASKAAEEAATGSWLQELESGNLPRIAAPGLIQGWFGPWDSASEEEASEKQAGAECKFISGACQESHQADSVWPGTDEASSKMCCAATHTPVSCDQLCRHSGAV